MTSPASTPPSRPLLSGQIALITGATGGIGKATARLLASLGASVALHYNSDQDGADRLQTELTTEYRERFGSRFDGWKADLGDYDDVRALHARVVSSMGAPTILINNAGSMAGLSGVSSAEEVDINTFEKTWRINCGSAYLLTQLCLPAMEKAGWGRVIFVSSVAGITGGIVGPHYASAKSALHGLVHWLANTYATKGVTINGVAPALIAQTKMLRGNSEELSRKIPIGRLGTPNEVAETIIWMIKSGYVTNKVIAIDGGMFPQ